MSILSDKDIRQVYSHLKMKPPEWIPEIDKAVAEDAYRETLKMVGEWLEAFHEEHSVNNVRYPRKDCDICIGRLKLGKLEVSNGR